MTAVSKAEQFKSKSRNKSAMRRYRPYMYNRTLTVMNPNIITELLIVLLLTRYDVVDETEVIVSLN